jgi:hypothetical protein
MTIPFFSKKRSYAHRDYDPERIRQRTGVWWHILITAAGIVVIVSVFYGGWLLWGAIVPRDAAADILPETESLSRQGLQEVLEGFAQRSTRYDFLLLNPPAIVDPAR